jgi:hypothetical protein
VKRKGAHTRTVGYKHTHTHALPKHLPVAGRLCGHAVVNRAKIPSWFDNHHFSLVVEMVVHFNIDGVQQVLENYLAQHQLWPREGSNKQPVCVANFPKAIAAAPCQRIHGMVGPYVFLDFTPCGVVERGIFLDLKLCGLVEKGIRFCIRAGIFMAGLYVFLDFELCGLVKKGTCRAFNNGFRGVESSHVVGHVEHATETVGDELLEHTSETMQTKSEKHANNCFRLLWSRTTTHNAGTQ